MWPGFPSSARFSSTPPTTPSESLRTLEMEAWQTKTRSSARSTRSQVWSPLLAFLETLPGHRLPEGHRLSHPHGQQGLYLGLIACLLGRGLTSSSRPGRRGLPAPHPEGHAPVPGQLAHRARQMQMWFAPFGKRPLPVPAWSEKTWPTRIGTIGPCP